MKLILNHILRKIKSYIPFIQNNGRQSYLEFKTNLNFDEIYNRLIPFGYQINYIGYNDKGEVLSLRKLYGMRQIHLRLFDDGEVRIHDEYNYEFYPIEHLKGINFQSLDEGTVQQLKEILNGYDIE